MMEWRTDLALERSEALSPAALTGVRTRTFTRDGIRITRMEIQTQDAAQTLGKPMGCYVTAEVKSFAPNGDGVHAGVEVLGEELTRLLPKQGAVLVVGLGNTQITPDALGPRAASYVLATRHIGQQLAGEIGLGSLRPVCVLSPGVLGQTGMETGEIIRGLVQSLSPVAVVVVDALASRRLARLGHTVQMTDTGVTPGSGVGNARARIDQGTMGVPVIAVGVPTVVDALTLVSDMAEQAGVQLRQEQAEREVEPEGTRMIVTPREIDLLIEHAAKAVGLAIGHALQPHISAQDMLALTAE